MLKRGSGGAVPQTYRAFSIGPEFLAIGVLELDVLDDEDALKKASPIFNDGLKRVEVWFGSRKVGDIPPKVDDISDDDAMRDSPVPDRSMGRLRHGGHRSRLRQNRKPMR